MKSLYTCLYHILWFLEKMQFKLCHGFSAKVFVRITLFLIISRTFNLLQCIDYINIQYEEQLKEEGFLVVIPEFSF